MTSIAGKFLNRKPKPNPLLGGVQPFDPTRALFDSRTGATGNINPGALTTLAGGRTNAIPSDVTRFSSLGPEEAARRGAALTQTVANPLAGTAPPPAPQVTQLPNPQVGSQQRDLLPQGGKPIGLHPDAPNPIDRSAFTGGQLPIDPSTGFPVLNKTFETSPGVFSKNLASGPAFPQDSGRFNVTPGSSFDPNLRRTEISNNPRDVQSNLFGLFGSQFGPDPSIGFGQQGLVDLIGQAGGAGGQGDPLLRSSRLREQLRLDDPNNINNFGELRNLTGFNIGSARNQGQFNKSLLDQFGGINEIPETDAFGQARQLGQGATDLALGGQSRQSGEISQLARLLGQGTPQAGAVTGAASDLIGNDPLASQRAQAFKQSTFDPLREELLGDLGRRGILNSTARLDSERQLFEQALINPLLQQDLQARGLGMQSLLGAGQQNQQGGALGLQGLLGSGGQDIQRFGAQGDLAGQRFGQARSQFLDPANLRLSALQGGLGREQGQGQLAQSGFRGTEDFRQNQFAQAGRRGDQDIQNDLARQGFQAGLFGDVRNFGNQFDQQAQGNAIDLLIAQLNRDAGVQTNRENRDAASSQANKQLIGGGIGAAGGIVAALIM